MAPPFPRKPPRPSSQERMDMPDAAASEFAQRPVFLRRLPRAVRRRLACYWAGLHPSGRRPTAEDAFEFLARALTIETAPPERPHGGHPFPCALTLGRAMRTAARFGQLDAVEPWLQALLSLQQADGSFPDVAGQPSRFHTAQAL